MGHSALFATLNVLPEGPFFLPRATPEVRKKVPRAKNEWRNVERCASRGANKAFFHCVTKTSYKNTSFSLTFDTSFFFICLFEKKYFNLAWRKELFSPLVEKRALFSTLNNFATPLRKKCPDHLKTMEKRRVFVTQ